MRGLFFCEDWPVFLCSIYYSFDVVAFNVVGVVAAHVVVILVVLIFFFWYKLSFIFSYVFVTIPCGLMNSRPKPPSGDGLLVQSTHVCVLSSRFERIRYLTVSASRRPRPLTALTSYITVWNAPEITFRSRPVGWKSRRRVAWVDDLVGNRVNVYDDDVTLIVRLIWVIWFLNCTMFYRFRYFYLSSYHDFSCLTCL